ncbi:hypothetical protein HanIR_Chr17g0877001 [Helianthus annuus]|nr:hypothetical protein HanIR_Chr17g0877001 [Helianthus annuus]
MINYQDIIQRTCARLKTKNKSGLLNLIYKKKAVWPIANATSGGTNEQIKIVIVSLEELENNLKVVEDLKLRKTWVTVERNHKVIFK